MKDVFQNLLKDTLFKRQEFNKMQDSVKWFRNEARHTKIEAEQLFREPGRLTTRPALGQMQLFMYDPKHKKELPYYDLFPLIFCIAHHDDGFLGINFHYLPLPYRAALMDALYDNMTNTKINDNTRMAINYELLKSASKYRYYQVCIKKYLYKHLRSRMIVIPATRWDFALFLPIEGFQKKSKTAVWRDSKRILAGKD